MVSEIVQHDVPEPFNEFVLWMQWFHVPCHRLQQREIQILRAAHELFQFLWRVQKLKHRLVKQFVKASLERINLLLTLNKEQVFDVQVDEFLPILFCNENLVAIFLEIFCQFFSKEFVIDGEGTSEDIFEGRLLIII